MAALRTASFMLLVGLWTIPFGVLVTLAIIFPMPTRYRIIALWRSGFMALCHYVLGIRYRVLGRENMPAAPAVVMAKHQSGWETVALQEVFPPLVFVLKKELLRVPFFGWGLAAMKMISIDRAAAKDALKQVFDQGRERLSAGYWVVIFPEGTRVAPGETARYKPGGAHLAVRSGAQRRRILAQGSLHHRPRPDHRQYRTTDRSGRQDRGEDQYPGRGLDRDRDAPPVAPSLPGRCRCRACLRRCFRANSR